MPNILDENGLQISTQAELIDYFTNGFKSIYGNDINLDPETSDLQAIMLIVQALVDTGEMIRAVYTSMDPDQAIGSVLNSRVAYNGIQRQKGTYTVTPISVTINQSVTLFGLDQTSKDFYTVKDDAGNEWILLESVAPVAAGTYVYNFRSSLPGKRLTIPNTITTAKTIVIGVTSINNPTAALSIGIDEETDAKLKVRRSKSVSLASQGYLPALKAELENINGVISAFIYENKTGGVVGGIPGHCIWVIISGTAADVDIAKAIYSKRNAGCDMFGSEEYIINQVDGSQFIVNWDFVQSENIYIKFTATSLNGISPPGIELIRAGLVNNFSPGVYEQVNINDLATAVQEIDNNTLVTNAGFSTSPTGPFTNTLEPSGKNRQFVLSLDNIIIIPIVLNPSSFSLSVSSSKQMVSSGGFGAYVYSMDSNPSGGSISGSGLYNSGATPGTDVIRVTDSQGNYSTSTAVVI